MIFGKGNGCLTLLKGLWSVGDTELLHVCQRCRAEFGDHSGWVCGSTGDQNNFRSNAS